MSIDPAVTHRIIGTEPEIIDETGLVMKPDAVYEDLASFDLLYVPGGFGTRPLMDDTHLLDYLKTWGSERPLASVCTGALLLGQAGYLRSKQAPTPHRAVDLLRPLCHQHVAARRAAARRRSSRRPISSRGCRRAWYAPPPRRSTGAGPPWCGRRASPTHRDAC